jgi:mannose-1-phosphate guanylyltransferase/phosphomannomutase
MRSVDAEAIRAAGYRVVVDYAFGSTAFVMPNVLSKLGAEVLSVNPYASTAGAAAFEIDVHAQRVAELVRTAKAHLGAVIDPDGERITLIDDEAHVLSNDEALLALLTLVTSTTEHAHVALPVSLTRQAERIAGECGASITWTKLSTPHLMEVASGPGVTWAASQEGGFIWPQFLAAYDATASFVNALELLAKSGLRLSKIVAGLPRTWVAHESVVTPWEHKGLVMRTLVERSKDRELVLVDGVKILHEDGWALVLPDPEEPLTHIWAEGASDADAVRLAQEYARRIRQILR